MEVFMYVKEESNEIVTKEQLKQQSPDKQTHNAIDEGKEIKINDSIYKPLKEMNE
jgi:hypothetical protein